MENLSIKFCKIDEKLRPIFFIKRKYLFLFLVHTCSKLFMVKKQFDLLHCFITKYRYLLFFHLNIWFLFMEFFQKINVPSNDKYILYFLYYSLYFLSFFR